jgi:hypothetical protein
MTYRPSGPLVVFEETTPLANGAEFTSAWYPRRFEAMIVAITSDVDLDYFLEFSPDETNTDSSLSYTYDASGINPPRRIIIAREFFRVRVQNNSGGAQTTFRMEVSEGSFPKLETRLGAALETDADALLVRSVSTGLSPDNTYNDERQDGYNPNFTTDTPLLNGQSFQSPIVDMSGYSFLINEIAADQDLSLTGEWFDDMSGTNLIRTFTLQYSGGDLATPATLMPSQYLRYTLTNNSGSDCTFTRLRVKTTNTTIAGQTLPVEGFVPLNVSAQLGRSILTGKNRSSGTYQNVELSRGNNLLVDVDNISITAFDELKTAQRYAQIELKSAVDNVSALRNFTDVTNGSVTVGATGEYNIATTATLGASALLQSGERGRYIPGYQAECGVGIRIPTQTWAGTQQVEWGYFDSANGFGYGIDATGKYIFIKRNSVTTKTYQSSWNKDTLDGSADTNNPSGYTLDFEDGIVSQIEFIWYGYGQINYYINIKDPSSLRGSIPVLVHTTLPDNQTSIQQPNLPISVQVNNGDQSTAREVFVGGRQFSIYGQPNERFRITGERRLSVGVVNSAWRPLISFRRKSGAGNNQSVELTGLNIIPDATVIYSFVTGGTLTGATFGNLTDVSPEETVLESDVSATAITGGEFFGGEYLATGSNRAETLATLEQLDFDFVNSDIVTLVCRSVGTSATIEAVTLNAREQW